MRINQKPCGDNRTINALIEQVSALQVDLGRLDAEVDNLDLSKANADELKQKVETKEVDANKATIGTATIPNLHVGEADGAKGHFTSIIGSIVEANNGDIKRLHSTVIDADTVNAGTVGLTNLNVTGETVLEDVTTANIEAADIKANGITANQGTIGSVISENVQTEKLVADEADIVELNVHGGVIEGVTVDAESLKAVMADIDHITTGSITMSDINELRPSGMLGPDDRYTIQLPVFTGSFYLVWKNNNVVVWSAIVTGNGFDYSISWNCVDKEIISVTNFFQYEGKLFIRTSANGALYYVYNATEELEAPWIYFNMNQWEKEPLEELCDERHQYEVNVFDGTISFGNFFVPEFTIIREAFENLEVNSLKINEKLELVPEIITWNGQAVKVSSDFTTDWVL